MKKFFFAIIFFAILLTNVFSQFLYDIENPIAKDSFRIGVEAYSRGLYAEALASFEKVISYDSESPLTLYWLGKSYYRMGMNNTAFDLWREASNNAATSPFLQSKLELFGAYQDPEGLENSERYVFVNEKEGQTKADTFFLRPSWIEPKKDGSCLLVSHGTNAILKINANGLIIEKNTGGVTGFDRPYACTFLSDGTSYVTEFQSDRIAHLDKDGKVINYCGDEKGSGKLSGPHYICSDENDFIYVVDVGFRRVVKYSSDGKMLLSFGQKNSEFNGFSMPTGIATQNGLVYVADVVKKEIFVFDTYGNFISVLDIGSLNSPESLRFCDNGKLLLSDGYRILLIDVDNEKTKTIYSVNDKKSKIVTSAIDANGDLLAADFNSSKLFYLSDPISRFSGFVVDIDRVYSDSFPKIIFDVCVRDKFGKAIVGLDSSNFYISEQVTTSRRELEENVSVDYMSSSIIPGGEYSFVASLDNSKEVDVSFLLEGSKEMFARRLEARDAITEIFSTSETKFNPNIVVAEKVPQPAVSGDLKKITASALNFEASDFWKFDSALRLSCSTLYQSSNRRAVIYIGTGSLNEAFLDNLSVAEMNSLLVNNRISLYAVIIGSNNKPSELLSYLVKSSGGICLQSDREEGLKEIISSIYNKATGMYRLSYVSKANDGFGKTYLPFNVEVYLRDKSGKDESGYFAPLR